MKKMVYISFGMIVLNGEPFVRYNLRSLYPWAHQIIVVEGACQTSKAVATPDGHSTDGTLEDLRRFQAEEDPEKKLSVVSARDEGYEDGFWPEKVKMCQAFAKRATGNYLWQVDSDEFYREQDMPALLNLLEKGVGRIAFPQQSFWGGIDHVNNSMYLADFSRRGVPRVFAWGPGYSYVTHRPATVADDKGTNVRKGGDISSRAMFKRGIYMYHYCLVFPSQALTKVGYYGTNSQVKADYSGGFIPTIHSWHSNFKQITRPYHLHNIQTCLSWIRPYRGTHPAQVINMMADIRAGRISHELRRTDDVERLMHSRSYRLSTLLLDAMASVSMSAIGYPFFRVWNSAFGRFKRAVGWLSRLVTQ
ncbi:MAG: glycosyltransferase family 2 protein [Thermoguttaceae bacterium]